MLRLVVVVFVLLQMVACAAVKDTTSGETGSPKPAPTTKSKASEKSQSQVFYAGIDGLKVYSSPSASGKVIGSLARYERVIRSEVDNGYAYVASPTSGLKGWVDNAQLIWRLPGTPAAAARRPIDGKTPETETRRPEPSDQPAALEAKTKPPSTPEATATPTSARPTSTPARPRSARTSPTPRGAAPSIFNPY